ncbi:unnamed protein product [Brassicogethes aeneus]|uniref:Nucleoprotein n=1 Tax=Brassicogethes aeneus TaxID=1431903 RepID=A0A9P0BIM3_BRAAE|nr:unnamed protein product [Brassicogethes aeneus]
MPHPTSVSQDDVAKAYNLNVNDYNSSLEVSGITPLQLNEHSQKATYQMIGMTPKDFITDHGAIELDFKELQRKFKSYCQDYMETISVDTKSLAVDFCAKVVYYVGPESRSVKKTTGDKYWRFKFPYTIDGLTDKTKISKVVFVATYKSEKTEVQDSTEANKLILTVKQASLLAMDTFDRLAVLALGTSVPKTLFTTLSGAIFSKNDLCSMSKELTIQFNKDYTEATVLTMINNSCQSNGHHLDNSNAAIALVAACVATRNIKDDKVKFSIISKIGKQYVKKGKNFNEVTFDIFAKYATGGVPSNMEPKKLIARLEEVQISTRQAAIASKDTMMSSTIDAPTNVVETAASASTSTTPAVGVGLNAHEDAKKQAKLLKERDKALKLVQNALETARKEKEASDARIRQLEKEKKESRDNQAKHDSKK